MADKKKILIVDDEPDVVRYLTVLLENNGFATIGAADGHEGMEKVQSDHPDLVVLDISMPKESGIKLYRNLQDSKEYSGIPVVMLTGVSREFERFISTRSQVRPPDAYFEKPVDDVKLVEKIRELVA
jgi:DNA-binding response OmpR family regulator